MKPKKFGSTGFLPPLVHFFLSRGSKRIVVHCYTILLQCLSDGAGSPESHTKGAKSFAEKVSPEATKTPVLWFHGMADGMVLFEAGHAGCAFLEELGMTCEFKACPTLGHSLVDEELQYFQQWIMDRIGMSGGTETARPSSSSSHHKDIQYLLLLLLLAMNIP
uniref:Phospholipase/carboxylesterase/thioesterase domain-containing protein n=1 Tax=Arundo donax TaxID=35708 RepID=A0A0A9BHN9_ARUDO